VTTEDPFFSPDNLQDVADLRIEVQQAMFKILNKNKYKHLECDIGCVMAVEWALWGLLMNGHEKEGILDNLSILIDSIHKKITQLKNDSNLS